MSKINISLSAAAPAAATRSSNPYLMADGLVNIDKIATLGEKAAKFLPSTGINASMVSGMYYIPRKAKPVRYSSTLAAKEDLKYMTQRALKVTLRKRATTSPTAKLLLPVLQPTMAGVSPALSAQIKQAAAALTRHMKKAETVKVKVTKKKGVIREAAGKVFDKSIDLLKGHLTTAGIKAADIIESKSMFGRTLLVKLSPENVISISGSDMSKFRAAKKAAAEAAATT